MYWSWIAVGRDTGVMASWDAEEGLGIRAAGVGRACEGFRVLE